MSNVDVRLNLRYIEESTVPTGVESYAYGNSFVEAVQDLIDTLEVNHRGLSGQASSNDWYYTLEDDGVYRFYGEDDLVEE